MKWHLSCGQNPVHKWPHEFLNQVLCRHLRPPFVWGFRSGQNPVKRRIPKSTRTCAQDFAESGILCTKWDKCDPWRPPRTEMARPPYQKMRVWPDRVTGPGCDTCRPRRNPHTKGGTRIQVRYLEPLLGRGQARFAHMYTR